MLYGPDGGGTAPTIRYAMTEAREYALDSGAWPFVEARALLERLDKSKSLESAAHKGYALFETGYGPSGLPHIGTFAEVARTSMVRHAFSLISEMPTRLFAFSDDMDGLRRVPDNVPNAEMLAEYAQTGDLGGVPLTSIPDPFGTHESFGHHNNARLRQFLDTFGFDYEFQSATECYRSGRFDEALLEVLRHYDDVMDVVLPTLRDERRKTYCPFLPLSPVSGRVLAVPAEAVRPESGTVVFRDETEEPFETLVTGGNCKLQWRVDWAMRWAALGVDYEMSGKDLIDSVRLSGRICRILGATPPAGFTYELFLDENGEKISKSRGNGLTIDEWLRYGPPESLAYFMYQKPKAAKRLYFDVIPRGVDEYLAALARAAGEDERRRLDNPVWHIHAGTPPDPQDGITYNVLLNLATVCHTEDKAVLWHFVARTRPGLAPENAPMIDVLVERAINYYRDFVMPSQRYRVPTEMESGALDDLARVLEGLPADADAEAIQTEVYEVGKRHPFADLKAWFRALYEILLGQPQGPRMGSFIALYGIAETVTLVRRALAGEDLES